VVQPAGFGPQEARDPSLGWRNSTSKVSGPCHFAKSRSGSSEMRSEGVDSELSEGYGAVSLG